MNSRERRERARRRLVVVRGRRVGTTTGVVPGKDKRAAPTDGITRRLEVGLLGEQELQRAVVAGARGGDIKAEDGRDVVGREDAVVLRAKGLVGFRGADLRDIVWELVLAVREVAWASVALVGGPIVAAEGTLGEEFAWGGEGRYGQEGKRCEGLESHDCCSGLWVCVMYGRVIKAPCE